MVVFLGNNKRNFRVSFGCGNVCWVVDLYFGGSVGVSKMNKTKRLLLDWPAWIDRPVDLEPGDQPCPTWPGCDYRITPPGHPEVSIPVNLKITGRKVRRDYRGKFIRVKVTIPGDSEPDQTVGGNYYR